MSLIDQYLELNNTTRYQVSKKSEIYASTLQRAASSDNLDNLSVRIIRAIVETVGKTPGKVLDDLVLLQQ